MVQEIWQKFNANERLVAIGAVIVIVAWLVGIVVGYGFGASTIGLLGAIGVLVVYYLKYAPNQNINWPAPIPTIVLGIAAIAALLILIQALSILRFLDGADALVAVGSIIGGALMAWGAWQEYQAMPKTAPPSPPTPPTPPA
jgi:membrane associated rhomboid family serine protease